MSVAHAQTSDNRSPEAVVTERGNQLALLGPAVGKPSHYKADSASDVLAQRQKKETGQNPAKKKPPEAVVSRKPAALPTPVAKSKLPALPLNPPMDDTKPMDALRISDALPPPIAPDRLPPLPPPAPIAPASDDLPPVPPPAPVHLADSQRLPPPSVGQPQPLLPQAKVLPPVVATAPQPLPPAPPEPRDQPASMLPPSPAPPGMLPAMPVQSVDNRKPASVPTPSDDLPPPPPPKESATKENIPAEPPARNAVPVRDTVPAEDIPQQMRETAEPPKRLVPQPSPVGGLQTVGGVASGSPAGNVMKIHQLASAAYDNIDSYIVRFRRREQVGGRNVPEELMLMRFRKQPFSVYLKWLGNEGKGREVVYVKGQFQNQLHTRLAAGDIPLMPAGKRISLAPDSPLVRSKSRYPITEAGIGPLIARFGALVENMERGDTRRGTLKYTGMVRRPEFPDPVEAVLEVIPPGVDPNLRTGGRRFWFFDTELRFPVLVITENAAQQEVEYYCHDYFLFPGRLSGDEFNPDELWRD